MMTYGQGNSGDNERVMQFLDYMSLANEFMKVQTTVSPVMLAAIYVVENGPDGVNHSSGGQTKKVYNLFNIGANTGGADALQTAFDKNWISRELCIKGSLNDLNAKFGRGQSTFYALDWNYKTYGINGKIENQYATLVTDAAKKGIAICQKAGLSNLDIYPLIFTIPVYNNLPITAPTMPDSKL